MKKERDQYASKEINRAIIKQQQNIRRTIVESHEQSQKRLKEINEREKAELERDSNEYLKEKIRILQLEKEQMSQQMKVKMKQFEQQTKKLKKQAQQEIQIERNKAQRAKQEMKNWKNSSEKFKQLYNHSQQKLNANQTSIQNLKRKNRNTIIQFKNRITSLQSTVKNRITQNHLKYFCTEKEIQTLLQKQKIYQELICNKDSYAGQKLIEYIQLCAEKERDFQMMLLSMTQKEEFYRNQAQTVTKENQEEQNRIVAFTAQCDNIEAHLKNTLSIQDNIIVKVNKLIEENERLNKQIQYFNKIVQKAKQIEDYSRKMNEQAQKLLKINASESGIKQFNLYKNSELENQKLKQKIKQLQEKLQEQKKRQYISKEDYQKFQNSMNSYIQKTSQQLLSLKNIQENSINLSRNNESATLNIDSSLFNKQKRIGVSESNIKFSFLEGQKQANESLIMAIEKFKNRSIISFTTLFKSSPSAKDNFGDQITLSDRSLLLIFKLAGSYLGVFSSQFNNENESQNQVFLFTFDSRSKNLSTFFKKQTTQQQVNRFRFSENCLIIGQNELILKNNSSEKEFMLNFRGARHSYFQLNPKVMGIEDKLIDNKVKYEGLAIERIYFQ